VEDVAEIDDKTMFVLKFTQSRNPEWTNKTFLAEFDESASWIDDLTPAFGEDFFFYEPELMRLYGS
jgi:hypothetical protein